MFVRIAALFAVIATAFARDLANYSFEEYVQDFGFTWPQGSAEWQTKQKMFDVELARVQKHNAGNASWEETMNRFSVMTPEEKKALNGHSKGVAREHAPKFLSALPNDFVMKPVSSLPTRVDWRDAGIVSPVKDQGHCGSCWAFASTSVIESAVAKESGLLFDLSVQQLAMCSPNPDSCGGTGGCNGATAEVGFDYVASVKGLVQEYQNGYAAYGGVNSACKLAVGPKAGITGFVKLPVNDYTALMNAVATVGPIAVSVDASLFHSYSKGIFKACNNAENVDINHAVTLVGYGEDNGEKYWLVRNSWSASWGEAGYIRVTRTDNDDSNCGVDSTPEDGNACSGDHTPQKTCGSCGILFDSSYPTGAHAL